MWWIVAAFLAMQLAIIASDFNGPFVDEALYTVAGLRVLEGHGFRDGYLAWFNGSPFVWPVVAALGYHAGGLAGARVMAALLSAVTLLAFAKTAEALFGSAAARWGAFALAVNGLFLALAHFAVYDIPALTLIAVSMWCVTRASPLRNGGHGSAWVIAGAIAFAAAVITKYGHAVMAVPLLGLLVAGRDAARARGALGVFLGVSAVIITAYFWTFFGSPYPTSSTNYFQQAFPRTRMHVAVLQVIFGFLPLLLASVGAVLVWRSRRRLLVVTCLLALAVYPAFHIWAANFVSGQKHVVAGFLFAYLLAGVALQHLATSRMRVATATILTIVIVWGALQCHWQDRSWSDTRALAQHLARNLTPGERVLAESPWNYALELYARGRIVSPYDVIDVNFTPPAEKSDPCRIPWIVGSPESAQTVRDALLRCRHEPVLSSTTHHYYFDTSRLRIATYPAVVSLYRLPR